MTVLVDQSGRLFTRGKCTLKDIVANQEVWEHMFIAQCVNFSEFVFSIASLGKLKNVLEFIGGATTIEKYIENELVLFV